MTLTNTPSAFYLQHHAVDAPQVDELVFRPFWRIAGPRTRLDRLFADGAIGFAEWRSGRRLRAAVEHLTGARNGYDRAPASDRRGQSAILRLDAMAHVRKVTTALGRIATALIWCCAIEDLAWASVGARFRVDPKTARKWTIEALRALAALDREGGS